MVFCALNRFKSVNAHVLAPAQKQCKTAQHYAQLFVRGKVESVTRAKGVCVSQIPNRFNQPFFPAPIRTAGGRFRAFHRAIIYSHLPSNGGIRAIMLNRHKMVPKVIHPRVIRRFLVAL
jgi:hypothetical protein